MYSGARYVAPWAFCLTPGTIILWTFAGYVTEVTILRQKEENYTFQTDFTIMTVIRSN